MKTPFKVGDRVRTYAGYSGDCISVKAGVIKNILPKGVLEIAEDGVKDGTRWAHPKQCRRLKKKERRRIWIRKKSDNFPLSTSANRLNEEVLLFPPQPLVSKYYVEFVEVKK